MRTVRFMLLVLSLGGGAELAAQTTAPPPQVDPALPPRVGVEPSRPRPISLDEAIHVALERNHDVEIARLDVRAAAEDVRAAQGVFDPVLAPSLLFQRATTPVTSSIGGAAQGTLSQDDAAGAVTLDARAPGLGSRLTLDLSAERTATTNTFARLNPQFPSTFSATYTQPLLRNLRIDADRRQVLLARRAEDLSDAQLTEVLMEQLSLIEEAYWELVYAAGNVDVQSDALAQARTQVASNERQAQQGTLAPIDVVEAQTQVATFEQSVAQAQQALTEAENQLKSLVLAERSDAMWNLALVASGTSDRAVPTTPLDEAVRLALTQRPELARMSALEAQNAIDHDYFADQRRPRVDLVGSYALSGLAGSRLITSDNPLQNASDLALYARLNDLSARAGLTALDVPTSSGGSTLPNFLEGGLGGSFANIFSRRFPTALVQVQLEVPLRNRTAEANVARTEIGRRQLARQRQQLEQTVAAEVRNALQRVRSAERRLAAAGSAVRGANEQYESERRRFEAGLSTVFLVLQRQTALVAARGQELRARADLNQAISVFDRATGMTLDAHGVALQAVRAPQPAD